MSIQQSENLSLLKLEQATSLLAHVQTVDEAASIRNLAEAARIYAKQAKLGLEAQNYAAAVKIRAERKAGQLLQERPKNVGTKGNIQQQLSGGCTMQLPVEPTYQELGIEKTQAHRWQSIADLPESQFEEIIATGLSGSTELTSSQVLGAVKNSKAKAREADKNAQAKQHPNPPIVSLDSWATWLPKQSQCDLLLTDPPYSTDVDDVESFAASWLPAALAKVKPTGRAYVCIGAYQNELAAYFAADHSGMTLGNILVWTYRNTLGPSPKFAYKTNWQAILHFCGPEAPPLDCPEMREQFAVQDINAPDGRLGDRYHAWQKPDELAERFVRHSTKEGDLVLDPFVCTGTFVLAASRLGRVGRGCDISNEHLLIAEERGCSRV